ncbi:hypothetical protein HMF8227_01816 [Saliniradius amylolyticus]|uniref:Probable membrane transporter protein n=1 Tax=Saliniradius amylolyticus TaxID=2183582 RepID=A0A2S2E3X4_9ALTE|nr:sulfite exporter TauE/SafE family protein [Saliniradius amylolyticus]AWL12289.1 hypothetical protein HMF8227_01816 [Saliniradius amylolyticus]
MRFKPLLFIWLLPLVLFYLVWLWLVTEQGFWQEAFQHWPMAIAMALGSYAAGSTPMGGGTVGFPILVLLFDHPASMGRDFSFAIQAIGMTSASLFILARKQPLAQGILAGAMLGALVGVPVGLFWLAPVIPELWIKLLFAVIWAGFGLLHLTRLNEIASHSGMLEFDERWDFRLGIALGLTAGATMVATTGVGIDMALYSALVLLFRADLKIAIPTSVIIMAFCSVLAVGIKSLTTGFAPGVWGNWLAAAPVVALGAPLGVFIVARIGRKPTLLIVALLCIGQFLWTLHNEYALLGNLGVSVAVSLVGILLLVFELLHRWGAKLAGDQPTKMQAPPETQPESTQSSSPSGQTTI